MPTSSHPDVSDICTRVWGTAVRLETVRPVGGGCMHHAVRLATSRGTFFLKWNQQGAADLFLREAEGLAALRAAAVGSSLVVPAVVAAAEITAEASGYLVLDFLSPPVRPKALDEAFGWGLAHVHRTTHPRFGFAHDTYCGATRQPNTWQTDWPTCYGQQRLSHLLQYLDAQRGLSSAERTAYDRLLDRLPDLLDHRPSASLTHGDLWSGNYLPTDKGPALVDPACAYADRETDLALMAMFGGFSERVWAAYQEAWPLPDGWPQRQPLYQLYHYLNHDYLFGGGYGAQALAIARSYS